MRVLSSEYNCYCQSLLEVDEGEGWSSELRRYLKDRPVDVTKDTDCCDSLLIGGSGRTCNKDMGSEGDTLEGWR